MILTGHLGAGHLAYPHVKGLLGAFVAQGVLGVVEDDDVAAHVDGAPDVSVGAQGVQIAIAHVAGDVKPRSEVPPGLPFAMPG